MTVIDTLREDETYTELSNPNLLANRETGNLEVRLTKINLEKVKDGQPVILDKWYSEAWEYVLTFES